MYRKEIGKWAVKLKMKHRKGDPVLVYPATFYAMRMINDGGYKDLDDYKQTAEELKANKKKGWKTIVLYKYQVCRHSSAKQNGDQIRHGGRA